MIGEKLITLRKKRKMTQQQVSKYLGIARTTYAGYERNERHPDYPILLKIAELFEVTTDYLLDHSSKFSQDKLSPELEELIKAFDDLPKEKQIEIINLARVYVAGLKTLE